MLEKNQLLLDLERFSNDNEQLLKIGTHVMGFDNDNKPNVYDGEILYKCYKSLKKLKNEEANHLIYERLIKGSGNRYENYIKKYMIKIENHDFNMGSNNDNELAYIGEFPKHKVHLNEFKISSIVVTNELYRKFNPNYIFNNNSKCPAVDLNWYDAYIFALWVGCRLPTEAEWELASGKLDDSEWCCLEKDLKNYAWYSENSNGYVHKVKELEKNKNGLYDMLGNVWEWVLDSYEENYYERSPKNNPLNTVENGYKVCRGGSIQAFSEMCRPSFRYYECANYKASDLGFRLVKQKEEI